MQGLTLTKTTEFGAQTLHPWLASNSMPWAHVNPFLPFDSPALLCPQVLACMLAEPDRAAHGGAVRLATHVRLIVYGVTTPAHHPRH